MAYLKSRRRFFDFNECQNRSFSSASALYGGVHKVDSLIVLLTTKTLSYSPQVSLETDGEEWRSSHARHNTSLMRTNISTPEIALLTTGNMNKRSRKSLWEK